MYRFAAVILVFFSVQAFGQQPPPIPPPEAPLSPDQFVETWAEVKYCREIYKLPDNLSRVYEFDTQQCDQANQLLESKLSAFPDDVRKQVELAAEQRQRIIMANTRDATAVLNACRDACRNIVPVPASGGEVQP